MTRLLARCAGLLVWLCATAAWAQEAAIVHVVRAGETLSSIAQVYYGDARRDAVLATENGFEEGQPPEGVQLVIPSVRYHRVARGESWRSIAEHYYGDPARAAILYRANAAKPSSTPDEGAQVSIPYPLRHRARSNESLSNIATHYYGTREEARLLKVFNGGRSKVPRGQLILVPLFDLKLSASGAQRVEAARGDGPRSDEARKAQGEVARELPQLRELIHRGAFVEAVALGNQLLGRPQRTGNQEISIQRELATAYVALGRDDLAIGAFARALEMQPDLELDTVRTSPRVLAALEAAKTHTPRVAPK